MSSTACGLRVPDRERLQPVGARRCRRRRRAARLGDALLGRPTRGRCWAPLPAVVIGALLLVVGFLYGLVNAAAPGRAADHHRDRRLPVPLLLRAADPGPRALPGAGVRARAAARGDLARLARGARGARPSAASSTSTACSRTPTGVWHRRTRGLPLGEASASRRRSSSLAVLLVTGVFLFSPGGCGRAPDASRTGSRSPRPRSGARSTWGRCPRRRAASSGGRPRPPDRPLDRTDRRHRVPTRPQASADDEDIGPVRGPGALAWIAYRITSRPRAP